MLDRPWCLMLNSTNCQIDLLCEVIDVQVGMCWEVSMQLLDACMAMCYFFASVFLVCFSHLYFCESLAVSVSGRTSKDASWKGMLNCKGHNGCHTGAAPLATIVENTTDCNSTTLISLACLSQYRIYIICSYLMLLCPCGECNLPPPNDPQATIPKVGDLQGPSLRVQGTQAGGTTSGHLHHFLGVPHSGDKFT